jgi:hypothetical protein
MKKLSIISNQIKNNTYSYTGKGSFEAIINNNKEIVLSWLEDLLPIQKQIELLFEIANINFQKRNYTRILTKVFPDEYKEFVSVNILVRDANIIAQYYDKEYNMTILYDKLINHKFLKYPGKYDKYVEYKIFQRFVMMYKDELVHSLESEHQSVDNSIIIESISENNIEIEKELATQEEEIQETTKEIEINTKKKSKVNKEKEPKDTNWTQLLLGRLK